MTGLTNNPRELVISTKADYKMLSGGIALEKVQ